MSEEAYEILDYLPYSFKTTQEQDYIDFLWDSFLSNYTDNKYQFASIAFHMLFMSAVYFDIWKIKINKEHDFNKALIGFKKDDETNILKATSPFVLSQINESQVFRFLKLVKCENCDIGSYSKIVKIRNNVAHSNGNIYFNARENLDDHIKDVIKSTKNISEHFSSFIVEVFQKFLCESWNKEEREFPDEGEQIEQILVQKNYLSKNDIQFCLVIDINELPEAKHIPQVSELFEIFKIKYFGLL